MHRGGTSPHVLNTYEKPCQFWRIETTEQSISTKMYYVLLSTKVPQGLDTASGTILKKSCSRICVLNPRLIYLNNILILKYLEFLKIYMQLTEHFP